MVSPEIKVLLQVNPINVLNVLKSNQPCFQMNQNVKDLSSRMDPLNSILNDLSLLLIKSYFESYGRPPVHVAINVYARFDFRFFNSVILPIASLSGLNPFNLSACLLAVLRLKLSVTTQPPRTSFPVAGLPSGMGFPSAGLYTTLPGRTEGPRCFLHFIEC